MSGASSLASARRRRAAPQQNEPMNVQNKIVEQSGEQKIAPLELLQLHDKKIASLQDNIEATVTNIVTEKLSKINFQGYNMAIKKLQEEIVNIKNTQTNDSQNPEEQEMNNVLLDETKITNIIKDYISNNLYQETNTDIINEIDKKTKPISSTLSSVIENIESLTVNLNNNTISKDKIEELLLEVNSLKVLLIKNQTLALESSNEIHKLKDKIESLDTEILKIKQEFGENVFDEKNEISLLKNELDMIHEMEKKITMRENENNLEEIATLTTSLE